MFLTWMANFRPRNKTIWIVVDVESDFDVEIVECLRLDLVFVSKKQFLNI